MRHFLPLLFCFLSLFVVVDGSHGTVVASGAAAKQQQSHRGRIRRRRSASVSSFPSPPTTSVEFASSATNHIVESKANTSAWIDGLRSGLASAMAAGCVKTLLQPVDAIKTMQQYSQASRGQSLSVFAAARELFGRPGGISNFYAGLGVTVFGSMPSVALYFGVYQYCKKSFLETDFGKSNRRASIAMAAAIGNSVASFSRVPYEVLKQKLQTGAYDSFGAALKAVAAAPVASLFPHGGVAIQMIRDIPYAVVTLLVYESLQELFTSIDQRRLTRGGDPVLSKQQRDFFVGGFAGGLGSWVTNPMDVIKTRIQTADYEVYKGSVVACTSALWQEGGPQAFLRGAVPRLVHKVPANAFFFLFYEFFRRVLGVEKKSQR